jgi:hypothetical protein
MRGVAAASLWNAVNRAWTVPAKRCILEGLAYMREILMQDELATRNRENSDNIDPREYLDRLEMWRQRVETEGGSWRVINDLDRLETLL